MILIYRRRFLVSCKISFPVDQKQRTFLKRQTSYYGKVTLSSILNPLLCFYPKKLFPNSPIIMRVSQSQSRQSAGIWTLNCPACSLAIILSMLSWLSQVVSTLLTCMFTPANFFKFLHSCNQPNIIRICIKKHHVYSYSSLTWNFELCSWYKTDDILSQMALWSE
jgi:hypothetical protein